MCNNLIIKLLVLSILFLTIKTNAQNKTSKHDAYLKLDITPVDSFPEKITEFKHNISLAEEKNDTLSVAKNKMLLAYIYYELGSFDISIEYNLAALPILKKHKDTIFTIYALHNLSAMYGEIKNSNALKDYSLEALKLSRLIKDTTFILHSHLHLGSNYIGLGQTTKAIFHLNKALELAKKIKHKEGIIQVLTNIGVLHFQMGKISDAQKDFLDCFNYIKNKEKNNLTAILYADIAETHYEMGDYKKAVSYGKISLDYFAKNKKSLSSPIDLYKALVKSYILLNKSKKAIEVFNDYNKIKEKYAGEKFSEQASKLKVLYETNKVELENENLKSENKLKEANLLASKQRFIIAIIILIFAFLIIVLFLFQNIKLKQSYKQIVKESVKSIQIENDNIKLKKIIQNKEKANTVLNKEKEGEDNEDNELFKQIIEIIETGKLYTITDFNLDQLSKKMKINRSYLSRSINKVYHRSFIELINEYRIAEAKKSLCSKDVDLLTIDAISANAGFNSKSTFYRVFKKETGVTPIFFMKNAKNV